MPYQLLAQRLREARLRLPQKRGHVVVERAAASALEVDEIRLIVDEHDVAALEVTVHEGVRLAAHQHHRHRLEVVLQLVLVKLQSGGFQETVFEIVEVPHHRAVVELRQREAFVEVQSRCSAELHIGQQPYRFYQQLALEGREGPCQAALFDNLVEDGVAQVGLQVCHTVVRDLQHLRHGQAHLAEMSGQIDECLVLGQVGADDAHHRVGPGFVVQAEIAAVGARSREFGYLGGLVSAVFLVKVVHYRGCDFGHSRIFCGVCDYFLDVLV